MWKTVYAEIYTEECVNHHLFNLKLYFSLFFPDPGQTVDILCNVFNQTCNDLSCSKEKLP